MTPSFPYKCYGGLLNISLKIYYLPLLSYFSVFYCWHAFLGDFLLVFYFLFVSFNPVWVKCCQMFLENRVYFFLLLLFLILFSLFFVWKWGYISRWIWKILVLQVVCLTLKFAHIHAFVHTHTYSTHSLIQWKRQKNRQLQ